MPSSEIGRESAVVASRCANVVATAGIGIVVGRNVDGLHRRDRAFARRGDALFEHAHVGTERRLITDGRRHAAHQRRDFGAGLHVSEDVVDEEQHVGAQLVAKVLRHRNARLRDAKAHAGRLVHLPEDERRLRENARLFHLEPQVVAFARALADAGEDREAFVHVRDVSNQLLNEHRLADAGAAEESHLSAARVRRHQIDDFDAGLEDTRRRLLVLQLRRRTVNRPSRRGLYRLVAVDRLAEHVENSPERPFADGHFDRTAACFVPRAPRTSPSVEPSARQRT